jgi:hypothetical protein
MVSVSPSWKHAIGWAVESSRCETHHLALLSSSRVRKRVEVPRDKTSADKTTSGNCPATILFPAVVAIGYSADWRSTTSLFVLRGTKFVPIEVLQITGELALVERTIYSSKKRAWTFPPDSPLEERITHFLCSPHSIPSISAIRIELTER